MSDVAIKLIIEWAEAYYEEMETPHTGMKHVRAYQRLCRARDNMLDYARGLGVTNVLGEQKTERARKQKLKQEQKLKPKETD